MILTIDFESRSPVDIKTCGAFVYAEDPLTEPTCLSVKVDDDPGQIWVPEKFWFALPDKHELMLIDEGSLFDLVNRADKVVAHNSMFEFLMWNWCCSRLYGWPALPMEKLHDTMAQCAYHALPLSLDGAVKALGLRIKKDMEGHKIMMRLARPRAALKAEREADPDWASHIYWDETPEKYFKLFQYCVQDSDAEYSLHRALRPLPESERKVWLMDQYINLRGVRFDKPVVETIVSSLEARNAEGMKRFIELTDGKVSSPRAYVALKDWVNDTAGLNIESVGKAETDKLLSMGDLHPTVREVLEIKSSLGKASTAKFTAMLGRENVDGRLRGMFQYHGATTGRWAGRGVQLHNLPRDSYHTLEWEMAADLFGLGSDAVNVMLDDPFFVASRMVRGALIAQEGFDLVCADFSAIEARGLAYLAGEDKVLEAFRDGLDLYKVAATDIFDATYEEITKDQRQIGKVVILACGYQGSVGAFQSMARTYGLELDDEVVRGIVNKWREGNQNIKRYWYAVEQCAINAIRNPDRIFEYRGIKFCHSRGFLMIRLPSGRLLHYFRPSVRLDETSWGAEKDTIFFWGMKVVEGKTTSQWGEVKTYGGKLVENIVQAFCRDLLAEAMLRLEEAGYPLILHVHDEAAAELPSGKGSLEEFEAIMEIVPPWAQGMPIKAEGWVGPRYQK